MATFLMVTHGTAGDVLPFIRLGASLVSRGHQITLATHAPYADPARRAGLDFVAIDTDQSYRDGLDRSADLLDARGPADLRRYYEQAGLFPQMRREIDLLASRHRPGDTVLVGRHTSALSVLIAAELLDAPAAWVAVAPVQLLVAPVAAVNVARGLADGINAVRADVGLSPVVGWTRWLTSARRTLGLWPRWFDSAGTAAPAGTDLTGFVTGDEDGVQPPADVASTLAADPPPVLVTGGTGQLLHRRFYTVALDAVSSTGRTALVVVPNRDMLPERLPPTAHWYPRLPFATVFGKVAVVLHHGGIGTAVRALRSGTPQVIMAYGADRPDNAGRLAAHDLARWSAEPEWSASTVAGHIEAAIADHGYRDRAAHLVGEPEAEAPARAARLLETLLLPPVAADDATGEPSGTELARRLRHLSPEERRLLLSRIRST